MQKLRILFANTLAFLISLLLIAGCSPSNTTDSETVTIEISESPYAPMNDFLNRFREAMSKSRRMKSDGKPIDALFPAEEIPADKLSWFLESYEDVTVKACKGIRFDNSDILIVFFYDAEVPDGTVLDHIAINTNMHGRPLIPPPDVYGYSSSGAIDDGFGVIAYSFCEGDMEALVAEIAFDAR